MVADAFGNQAGRTDERSSPNDPKKHSKCSTENPEEKVSYQNVAGHAARRVPRQCRHAAIVVAWALV